MTDKYEQLTPDQNKPLVIEFDPFQEFRMSPKDNSVAKSDIQREATYQKDDHSDSSTTSSAPQTGEFRIQTEDGDATVQKNKSESDSKTPRSGSSGGASHIETEDGANLNQSRLHIRIVFGRLRASIWPAI